MKILVTGAKGFVGKNLCAQLNNIKEGKARYSLTPSPSPNGEGSAYLKIDEVFEYDLDSTPEQLEEWCQEADFVFNLAGVNRPKDPKEFMKGNFGFASLLLDTLKKHHNTCPVMISSSIQATLAGRFENSEYGRSKKEGEELMFRYSEETGAKVLVYRFPNLYGKWCRPNYNSVIATFCNNIANDLPITVNDPSVELELLYIDDLVDEMILALKGQEHHCEFEGLTVIPKELGTLKPLETLKPTEGRYCYCPITHKATLGEIVDHLHQFHDMPQTLLIPEIGKDSFAKRLYSTYLSYLPKEKAIFDLKMNVDQRGSFTELVHTLNCGQVSINISKPGITKGQHWHNTKWEQFIVVSGHGLIQMRSLAGLSPALPSREGVGLSPALPTREGVGLSPALPTREGVGLSPALPTREGVYYTADPTLYMQLEEKAKEKRKNPTEAESAMWNMLRAKGMEAKFRRQHIIGDYIVDFVDLTSGLVVEIDGGYHNDPEQKELDAQRTAFLMKKGFSVIRFTNEEVLFNTDETLTIIKNALKHLTPSLVGRAGERPTPSLVGRAGERPSLSLVGRDGERPTPSLEGRVGERPAILNYLVSGNSIQSVIMLPGYTHNIINLSDTQDLVTVMYCNEVFDPNHPDTYFDPVVKE